MIGRARFLRYPGGGVVWARSILDLGTVNDGCTPVRGVLRFGGEGVVKFYAEICNVIFHRETADAVGVIPLEVVVGVQVSFTILGDFVVLFEDSHEMESMALPHIFNTKVINKQARQNRAPLVAPQARSCGALVAAMLLETFFGENVGQGP